MSNTAVAEAGVVNGPTEELVEAVSRALDEPAWLRDHRLTALAHYRALDWPTGREEEWRRTPLEHAPLERYRLSLLEEASARPAPSGAGAHPQHPAQSAAAASGGLVQQADHTVMEQRLADDLRAQGVLLLPLSQAARDHEPLVRAHLNTTTPLDHDRFTALSGALWSQGLFCWVPTGVQIEPTLWHVIGKNGADQGLFGHSLIVAAPDSSVTLVEAAASADGEGAALINRSVEVVAEENARVRLIEVQDWGADAYAIDTVRARLGRGANVLLASAAFGGALYKGRLDAELTGEGSSADLVGLFVGAGRQHIEYSTQQIHDGVSGRSDLLIKGALEDSAQAVQYGLIHVLPSGQKSNSQQTMRNLLLSDGCRADPIPVLEIEADDVQCSHAAAVGPVDQEQLFYLQARGIPRAVAERMVVLGFLRVAVDRLPDAQVRTLVEELAEGKLGAGADA